MENIQRDREPRRSSVTWIAAGALAVGATLTSVSPFGITDDLKRALLPHTVSEADINVALEQVEPIADVLAVDGVVSTNSKATITRHSDLPIVGGLWNKAIGANSDEVIQVARTGHVQLGIREGGISLSGYRDPHTHAWGVRVRVQENKIFSQLSGANYVQNPDGTVAGAHDELLRRVRGLFGIGDEDGARRVGVLTRTVDEQAEASCAPIIAPVLPLGVRKIARNQLSSSAGYLETHPRTRESAAIIRDTLRQEIKVEFIRHTAAGDQQVPPLRLKIPTLPTISTEELASDLGADPKDFTMNTHDEVCVPTDKAQRQLLQVMKQTGQLRGTPKV
jgi:hypothetical protein